MDVVLEICDDHFFTPYIYPEEWKPHNIWRQFITLNVVTCTGGALLYLITASISYTFIFDKRLLKHQQSLQNQVRQEIAFTMKALPWMGIMTSVCFLAEVRGYSKLYDSVGDAKLGWFGICFTIVSFLFFTDCLIYWIHRFLHHKLVYKHLHKDHHRWKVPTPFASHAFHPIDGFLQSLPYHIYVFMFPMHKYTYLILYVLVNIWTVSIHDGDFRVPKALRWWVNGSAHHMDHHVYYNYNYGQYLTIWDRIGGSFRTPSAFDGKSPLDDVIAQEKRAAKKVSNGVHREKGQ